MSSTRVVVVEGVQIPEALIAQEAQNHPSLSAPEAWSAAARALAIKTLLVSRAREIGLQASPEFDGAGREETEDEALIRAVLDAEVEAGPPTTAECRRVYEAQSTRFKTPPLYAAAHILITPRDASPEAVEQARQVAVDAIALIGDRKTTFAEAAERLSDCASAGLGGALGQLQPGDLAPEVETALLALEPATVAKVPVRSRFGWHVLKLESRIEGRSLPFDLVEDQIRLQLEARAWTVAASRYVADLAARARLQGVALSLSPGGVIEDGSFVLGDLLGDSAIAARAEAWLADADPALAERVAKAAETAETSIQDFVRQAVDAFVAEAQDERWTQLISAVQDADDPALAAIRQILRSQLTPQPQSFTLIRRRGA